MAGHNKWSKVKRMKAVFDGRRSKVFSRLSREITVTAKSGGGDPDGNPRLRTLLLKARDSNMPAENVDRAIKKGTGELPGVVFEEITYEGYGPGGVAFIIQATTDNKNRAASHIRAVFTDFGGHMAGAGSVAFQFKHAGQFLIAREQIAEEALLEAALDAGADDVITTAEGFEVRCNVHAFDRISAALERKGIKPEHAEIAYLPTNSVPVDDVNAAKTLLLLHEALEELDDVQQVFSNEEMAEAVSAAAHG
jgi:YebC/PmpR family DNA-binding regulatory protein